VLDHQDAEGQNLKTATILRCDDLLQIDWSADQIPVQGKAQLHCIAILCLLTMQSGPSLSNAAGQEAQTTRDLGAEELQCLVELRHGLSLQKAGSCSMNHADARTGMIEAKRN